MRLEITQQPLRVFIGYDSREHDAYEVCKYSLMKHSSIPLAIRKLDQEWLRLQGFYKRPQNEPASTAFAFTRFLVPFLSNYQGYSLFVDCDFLFTRDIAELWPLCDRDAAVNAVKHDYVPAAKWKMDGQPQVAYYRKNWSSLMVFNNGACDRLTPTYVNNASAACLHQLAWVGDEQIHGLPLTWNWLEGEGYPIEGDRVFEDMVEPPAAIHFTNGGPWFPECKGVEFGGLWRKYLLDLKQ